jgi:hypothetical protein
LEASHRTEIEQIEHLLEKSRCEAGSDSADSTGPLFDPLREDDFSLPLEEPSKPHHTGDYDEFRRNFSRKLDRSLESIASRVQREAIAAGRPIPFVVRGIGQLYERLFREYFRRVQEEGARIQEIKNKEETESAEARRKEEARRREEEEQRLAELWARYQEDLETAKSKSASGGTAGAWGLLGFVAFLGVIVGFGVMSVGWDMSTNHTDEEVAAPIRAGTIIAVACAVVMVLSITLAIIRKVRGDRRQASWACVYDRLDKEQHENWMQEARGAWMSREEATRKRRASEEACERAKLDRERKEQVLRRLQSLRDD